MKATRAVFGLHLGCVTSALLIVLTVPSVLSTLSVPGIESVMNAIG